MDAEAEARVRIALKRKSWAKTAKWRAVAAERGQCYCCGRPNPDLPRLKTCPHCRARAKRLNAEKRRTRRAKGLCANCGAESGGKYNCPTCAVKYRMYHLEYEAKLSERTP